MQVVKKAIVIVAPNGARRSQADHQALPVSATEVTADALRNLAAGATMIHAHARKADGSHSLEIDDNLHLYASLKAAVGDELVIQLTTEAVGIYHVDQQIAMVKAVKPEAVSLGLREFISTEEDVARASDFFHWVAEQGIIAQYILYSKEDVAQYHRYKKMGVIPQGLHHLLFVLGRYSKGLYSQPVELLPFVLEHHDETPWAVCAFGYDEHRCASAALALGGDVRVGFENNMLDKYGEVAGNNALLVSQVVDTAHSIGREILSAKEFRAQFGLV